MSFKNFLNSVKTKNGDYKSEYSSFPKRDNKIANTNVDICSSCGGQCCKRCGCCFSPDDFEDKSFEGLKSKLDQGYISIDIIEGRMFNYYKDNYILRARNKDKNICDIYGSGGECDLLTPQGCLLSYEERPTGAKLIIPKKNFDCFSTYEDKHCSIEWEYFQEILFQLSSYYQEQEETHHYENKLVRKLEISKKL